MINEEKHFLISIFIRLMQLPLLSLKPTNHAILGYEAIKKMKQKIGAIKDYAYTSQELT
jgi:hypothetical protein